MAYPRGNERWDADRFEFERSRADRGGGHGGRRYEDEEIDIDIDERSNYGRPRRVPHERREEIDIDIDERSSYGRPRRGPTTREEIDIDIDERSNYGRPRRVPHDRREEIDIDIDERSNYGRPRRIPNSREEIDIDIDERSNYGRPRRGTGTREDIEIDVSRERGGGRPIRRPMHFEDRHSPSPPRSIVSRRDDNRRESINIDIDRREGGRRGPPPRPVRPGYMRRQSSLDTFDRRPRPRYDEDDEEIDIRISERDNNNRLPPRPAYRPPPNVPIPLPRRRRSPPRYEERDFEEIRISEPGFYGDDQYHEYHRPPQRRPRSGSRVDIRESSETIEIEEREKGGHFPRRGRTKIPRKLIDVRAANQMGYPYEEDFESITILLALGGDQIDEVVRISDRMRREEGESIRIEETQTRMIEAPPPPPMQPLQSEVVDTRSVFREDVISSPPPQPGYQQPQIIQAPPAPPPQIITLPAQEPLPPRTEIIHTGGGSSFHDSRTVVASEHSHHGGAEHDHWKIKTGDKRDSENISINETKSRRSRSRHRRRSRSSSSSSSASSRSPRKELVVEETSNRIGGPLSIFDPDRRKSDRDLKAEIRALDREKRELKREARRDRDNHHHRRSKSERRAKSHRRRRSGIEIDAEEIEVKRDRRGKMELVAR